MSKLSTNPADAIAAARAQDCDVIYGAPTLLLLDLDSEEAQQQYVDNSGRVIRLLAERDITLTRLTKYASKSKLDGIHIVLQMSKPLPVGLRMVLQMYLGSDPLRECLSVMRIVDGVEEPSMLFRPRKTKKNKKKSLAQDINDDFIKHTRLPPFRKMRPVPVVDEYITDDDVPF